MIVREVERWGILLLAQQDVPLPEGAAFLGWIADDPRKGTLSSAVRLPDGTEVVVEVSYADKVTLDSIIDAMRDGFREALAA